jgi:uncharacterized protein (DUF1800 family)
MYAAKHQIRPVVEAILQHPALYTGPRMVKPPVVYAAGMLRALGRGITTTQWFRVAPLSGQRLFYPPNVAGWDESRWLDTATFRGRWFLAALALLGGTAGGSGGPAKLVDEAVAYWRNPALSKATRNVLLGFATRNLAAGAPAAEVEIALRQLVATSPDLQTA